MRAIPFAYAYSIATMQGARKPHHRAAGAGSAMGVMGCVVHVSWAFVR